MSEEPPPAGARLVPGPDATRLCEGDCLVALAGWGERGEERAALIYLDPPFMTDRDFGSFSDIWRWGEASEADLAALSALAAGVGAGQGTRALATLLEGLCRGWPGRGPLTAYLVCWGRRLELLTREVLSPSGTLALHCDPTVSHYAKLLLDALLGRDAFLNELIWHYRRWPARCRFFQRMHDVLLLYRAGAADDSRRTFNVLHGERAPSTQKRWGDGKIRASHDAAGRRLPSRGEAEPSPGPPLDDVWELPIVAPVARERVGFPTQKPLALLERLIAVTTGPGDLVVDPCCGSGTTLVAAQRLGRRAVGVDLAPAALQTARARLDCPAARRDAPPAGAVPADQPFAVTLSGPILSP